jgi:hypothetical protein
VRPNVEAAVSIFFRQGRGAWPLCGINDWDYELAA